MSVDENSNENRYFIYQNNQCYKINMQDDFEYDSPMILYETPTHMSAIHKISIMEPKMSKSDSKRVKPKVWYLYNQHDSLNQF